MPRCRPRHRAHRPSAPRPAGNAQATVDLHAAPASDGGSAITGYTVTATDSTTPAQRRPDAAAGSGSPITVTGLTNGDSYTFTVTATNGAAPARPRPPSNAVVARPRVPGAPTVGDAPRPATPRPAVTFTLAGLQRRLADHRATR